MIRPLRSLLTDSSDCTYFHAAYAATAKLSLGSVQFDKLVTSNTYIDMTSTLTEINRCLSAVHSAEESYKQANDHTDQALNSLLKSIDIFRQSCARYREFAERQTKKKLESNTSSNSSTPTSTPIHSGRSSLPSADNDWSACIPAIISALQHTSEVLPSAMRIMKRKPWRGKPKQMVSLNEVMSAFVETMVLLAHMRFDIDDEDSYGSAYENLSSAEEMCVFNGFSNGYRWVSNTYYKIGVTLHNAELYAGAVYPLRKACSLLEKDETRASTDTGRLQLCKRYEVLGTCCQKDKRFEDATKAFKLALKRLPSSTIEAFVKEADSLAIYTLMGKHPLIPKLIERYLRATISDESDLEISFASEAMDLRHLESSQKSIIYECELRSMYMLSSSTDCTRQQNAILNALLRHYTARSYPIRRAR
ncbi:hypothetical protein BDB00DRAFT_774403 [Zychaea mexicana]|uniref:uncharacterized protein n=1 Tax=Zychaea mexicana TaxID=64656 RepID=UPI0022FE18E1|nr:uncharacterized protein BDB00DRAFT_774403 [Zychaea mexicana]KAI9484690.1 hypothetical protein BDB00DRAFT_774403 [Zychaea mexicana]